MSIVRRVMKYGKKESDRRRTSEAMRTGLYKMCNEDKGGRRRRVECD